MSPSRTLKLEKLIDLQCNGAFGIDLLGATRRDLDRLSEGLNREGVVGFCPTLISSTEDRLIERVAVIGEWIREGSWPGAVPLGIHLEGPFIAPGAAGVHSRSVFRKATLRELDRLWRLSRETIKVITLAPEIHSRDELKRVVNWCRDREVRVSIGHSEVDYLQAMQAFDLGISSVTHAWNASKFHHREPGVLGAALGDSRVYVQMIPDRLHVHPVVVKWVTRLHPTNRIILVSDAAPSAGSPRGRVASFGALQVESLGKKAVVLDSGNLAGGGECLTGMFASWVQAEYGPDAGARRKALKEQYSWVTSNPLKFLGSLPKELGQVLRKRSKSLIWQLESRVRARSWAE